MPKRVLVTGATGTVGRGAINELNERGVAFRVFTRDGGRGMQLGPDVAEGDFADPPSIAAAMDGIDAVLLVSSQHPDMASLQRNVVNAASAAGIGHIVKVSGGSAVTGVDKPTWAGRAHAEIERQIGDSGIGYSFLRPNYFMQNLLAFANPLRDGKLPVPLAGQRVALVDGRDVGTAAAAILASPAEHRGRVYDITGARALTFAEIAGEIGAVLGRPVDHVSPPVAAAVEAMKANGAPEYLQQHVAELMAIFAQDPSVAVVSDAFAQIVGRPPTPLVQFVSDHATSL